MFHPSWPDAGKSVHPKKDAGNEHCKLCGSVCQECGHSTKVHRLNGACYGSSHCLCGWTRDMNGRLSVKSTGEYADEGRIRTRPRNKGVKIGTGKRADILKIPCYFCGGKPESIDHFIARSRGGLNDRSNLVSACHVCNGMKGDKSYEELIEFCRQMETASTSSKSLRKIRTFMTWKEQAKKILAWHEKRIAARQQLPVV